MMTFTDNPELALEESRQVIMTVYAPDRQDHLALCPGTAPVRWAWNLSCDRERSRGGGAHPLSVNQPRLSRNLTVANHSYHP